MCFVFFIFQYLRLQDVENFDGNSPPWLFGSYIPLISLIISFLSYLTSTVDSLQPDTIQEIIQVVTFAFINLAVRIFTFAVSLTIRGIKTLNLQLLELN